VSLLLIVIVEGQHMRPPMWHIHQVCFVTKGVHQIGRPTVDNLFDLGGTHWYCSMAENGPFEMRSRASM